MSLSRWQRSIVTEAGDTIAEAEIEVFDAGESSKPDLFQDSDGSTALTNPFNADGSGFAAFYVAGGRYDIAVNGSVIWTDVALGTVQSRDVGTGSDQVPDISALESALGIDTDGPAGADVLAAVGRGAIVESDTNANGSYVRWENGEQVCWAIFEFSETEDGSDTGPQSQALPADFVNNSSIYQYSLATDGSSGVEGASVGGYGSGGEIQFNSRFRFRAFVPNISSDGLYGVFATAWGFWK